MEGAVGRRAHERVRVDAGWGPGVAGARCHGRQSSTSLPGRRRRALAARGRETRVVQSLATSAVTGDACLRPASAGAEGPCGPFPRRGRAR